MLWLFTPRYLTAVDPESLDQRALNCVGQEHRDGLSPEQRMQNHTLVVNALAANGDAARSQSAHAIAAPRATTCSGRFGTV